MYILQGDFLLKGPVGLFPRLSPPQSGKVIVLLCAVIKLKELGNGPQPDQVPLQSRERRYTGGKLAHGDVPRAPSV